MVARATAPNRIGPGSVFPDAAKWDFSDGLKGMFDSQIGMRIAKFIHRESNGASTVLDRSYLSANHCLWLLLVLSQGTTWFVHLNSLISKETYQFYETARP